MCSRGMAAFFISVWLLLISSFSMVWAECVAVIPAGWHHYYWRFLVEGARDAARDYGVDLLFRAPHHEGNLIAQKNILRGLHEDKGCNAFVIAPIDSSLNVEVDAIINTGGRVVYVDRDTVLPSHVNALVLTNNYEAGRQAARVLSQLVGTAGKFGVLRMRKGVASTDAREQGFVDMARELGHVIPLDIYLGETRGEAMRWAYKALPELGTVDGIFTPNESTTLGVLFALSRAPSNIHPQHIGFDLTKKIAQKIESNTLQATVVQSPYLMGYKGVEILFKGDLKVKENDRFFTPVYIVTKDNIADFPLE